MTLLTLDETASYLKIKKRTLYNWRSQGKIEYIKLGGLKFDKEYLDNLIRKNTKTNGIHTKKIQETERN